MSYRTDKLVIDTRTDTHTGNDNTRRPILASGKKRTNMQGDMLIQGTKYLKDN